MKSFSFSARDRRGRTVKDTRQAISKEQLETQLKSNGLLISSIKEEKRAFANHLPKKRVKLTEILVFLRELSTITAAGIPITEAISMIKERPASPGLSAALHSVDEDVRRGKPLPVAIAEHDQIFEAQLATTIQIGMASGNLTDALERYQRDLKMRAELARKFRKAMAYPLFLLGLLVVVLVVLFTLILPNFVNLYAEFGAELPRATQLLLRTVETAPLWIGILCAIALSLFALIKGLAKSTSGRLWLDQLRLKTPVFGKLHRLELLAHSASSLSLLLYSGMPLRSALNLLRTGLPNARFAQKIKLVEVGLEAGARFSTLSLQHDLFSGSGAGLIRAGERTGTLDNMLQHTANLYEQELNDQVDVVTSLIEPIMMVIIGGVIGLIVITVYLPIFGVSNVIQ